MFCTCSRICSISTFMSTAARVVSMSWDFEDSVLASRLSSCIRKSSRRPAGFLAVEGLANFGDVAAQAVDLLVDVQALRQDGEFLFEPVLIDIGDELRDAVEQLRAHAGADLRQPLGDASGEFQQAGAALLQRVAQASALAVAGAARAPPGLRRASACAAAIIGAVSRLASRMTPGQRSRSSTSMRAAAPACAAICCAREVKRGQQLGVDFERRRDHRGPKVQRTLDFAAAHGGGDRGAEFRLRRRGIPRAGGSPAREIGD